MELKIRKHEKAYIIDVFDNMDLYNSHKLKEVIVKMIEKQIESIVINLENVDYIDSSGVGVLIHICTLARKQQLKVYFVNIHGSVKKVIELTKLMGYFPIKENVEEALKEF